MSLQRAVRIQTSSEVDPFPVRDMISIINTQFYSEDPHTIDNSRDLRRVRSDPRLYVLCSCDFLGKPDCEHRSIKIYDCLSSSEWLDFDQLLDEYLAGVSDAGRRWHILKTLDELEIKFTDNVFSW